MKRRTFLAGMAGTASLAAPLIRTSRAAGAVTLTVHHFLPATSTTHRFLESWARGLEQASDGGLRFTLFPGMTLGGRPPQLYDQVREGFSDLTWTLPGYTPGRFPRSEVFELPFLAPPSARATSVALQRFGEMHLLPEFRDVKVILLHAHAPGSFHLRRRPIRRLEDLAGAKVRAPSRVVNDTLAALGATPVGMPVPEVPQALAHGVIDGALLPYEVTRSLRVHEMTDSNTEIGGDRGLYTAVFLLAMNWRRYQELPAELRDLIDAHGGPALAERAGTVWDEAEAVGRAAALESRHTIHTIAGVELDRWQAAAKPVTDRWVAAMESRGLPGEALLKDARALAAL